MGTEGLGKLKLQAYPEDMNLVLSGIACIAGKAVSLLLTLRFCESYTKLAWALCMQIDSCVVMPHTFAGLAQFKHAQELYFFQRAAFNLRMRGSTGSLSVSLCAIKRMQQAGNRQKSLHTISSPNILQYFTLLNRSYQMRLKLCLLNSGQIAFAAASVCWT